jgi:hypothetical protein
MPKSVCRDIKQFKFPEKPVAIQRKTSKTVCRDKINSYL